MKAREFSLLFSLHLFYFIFPEVLNNINQELHCCIKGIWGETQHPSLSPDLDENKSGFLLMHDLTLGCCCNREF